MSTRAAVTFLAALALALSLPACARRYPGALSPRALEERGLRIVGARAVDPEDVAGLARCERVGTPEASCEYDALWALYDRRGHPRATFSLRRVADRDGHAAHELVVDEGPLFRVERVVVRGLEHVPVARPWLEVLPVVAGQPFSAFRSTQARDELVAALRGAGYGAAEVEGRMDPDLPASVPGAYAVVVTYDAAPGPRGDRWSLGGVEVRDPDERRKARIAREVAPLLRPGEPFEYTALAAARSRLRRYRTAEVLVGEPLDGRQEVFVVVQVSR
jgi:hypothetical protein